MKKMLLCALIAVAGMGVDLISQPPMPMPGSGQGTVELSLATNVTNNTTKTIALRFGSTKLPGVARILKPGDTKIFYNSCSFLISIADIDPNNIPAGINDIEKLLNAASNEDEAIKIINNYKNNVDYIKAINSLKLNFVTVDNQPATCQQFVDHFNFTVSEDANGKYKIKAESANLQSLSTPATSLTNVSGTESAS